MALMDGSDSPAPAEIVSAIWLSQESSSPIAAATPPWAQTLEPDCPARRIEAFCKLLDDVSTYQQDRQGRAAELRAQVFRLAAPFHPLVRRGDRLFGHEEAEVKAKIAASLGRKWDDIDRELHQLTSQSAVDDDLERLKAELGAGSPPQQSLESGPGEKERDA